MKKLFDEYDFPFFEYGNIDLSNVENVKNNINMFQGISNNRDTLLNKVEINIPYIVMISPH